MPVQRMGVLVNVARRKAFGGSLSDGRVHVGGLFKLCFFFVPAG